MNTSQITFLYFDNLPEAKTFFEEVLELEKVYDPEWAVVYRTTGQAFLGAVDATRGSIPVLHKGGVLISITVDNIEKWYARLDPMNLTGMTAIEAIESVGLKSFFFKGPEGYDFEIQQFVVEALKELF